MYAGYQRPSIKLYHTEQTGVDMSGNIHIRLRRDDGTYFDNETLLLVGIHELSHVISDDFNHGLDFVECYDKLKSSAIRLGMISSESLIDKRYPRFENI
jgi:hypothetical protein